MKKVLIIIQRANGDVFLSSPLINAIADANPGVEIDLLVNDDTLGIANTLENVNNIICYSYKWRKKGKIYRCMKELKLFRQVWKKYDLSICLTSSDRSNLLAILAGKMSIGAVEPDRAKSWWKRKLLSRAYITNESKHIVTNNAKPLEFINAKPPKLILKGAVDESAVQATKALLHDNNVNDRFIIFHPTAQYQYKVYPEHLRTRLLTLLNDLGVSIVVTGTNSEMDKAISDSLPRLENIHNFMGKTSLAECVALTKLCDAYVGMDTLNMHLAAGFDKDIFAIFGPTSPKMWSPWSNEAQRGALQVAPVQRYGKVRLFQANLPCVACGLAGCDDKGGRSECLYEISPNLVFNEFKKCWSNVEALSE